MMRGGKEEEKDGKISATEGPMFPRLHVNDTEKGGPRAPPRNKMALYEQLSIPSQRFNSTSLPSTSSQNGNLHDRSVLPPFPTAASTSACSPEKVYSRSSDGENMKTMKMEHEKRSTGHVDFISAKTSKAIAEGSHYPRDSSSMKKSRQNEVDDDDDFRVPTFVNSDSLSYLNKDANETDKKRFALSHGKRSHNGLCGTSNSSVQFPNSRDKLLEQGNTSDMKSVTCERNHNEQKSNDAAETNKHREKFVSHPEAATKLALPSKFSMSSSGKEHSNTINGTKQIHLGSSGKCEESWGNGSLDGHGCLIGRDIQNEIAWRVRRELRLDASCGTIRSNPIVTDNCNNQDTNGMEGGPPEVRDKDRIDDLSDTTMVDSISGLAISPDDVVGAIGPKQFWKARRAIVNQQRVFAVQVFELHRLIKVQKLIASSPHLLLEENPCITPQKVPIKNLAIEYDAKSLSPTIKQKVDSQKPDQNTESRKENSGVALLQAPPLPAHDNGLSEGVGQPSRYAGPYSGNVPPVPSAPDNRSSPWCFQPPTNQWLVPVMSPSEGLIYKPYAGPCPPPAGLMAPVFGNYNPMSLPTGYSVPPCYQQQNFGVLSGSSPFALNYFPTPYGVPAMNSVVSNSAVDQVSPMTGPKPNGQTEQNSRSSCNMSFPKSDAFTGHPLKIRASKDSELQGSSGSSPCDRAQGGRDVLPLFPMPPTVEDSVQPSESNCEEHHTRVIKVVPHNARSATESAARIFRSIQKERRQVD